MTFNWFKKRSTPAHSPLSAMEAAIRAAQGCDAVQIIANTSADLFPLSAERRRQKQQEEEALRNPTPGTLVPGQGIFLCKYTPVDEKGKSLRKTFNVFAAPEDLTYEDGIKFVHCYKEVRWQLSHLPSWHGHDGACYTTDAELYQALKKNKYHGEWVIPTQALLVGTDQKNNIINPNNLYAHQETGAFLKTFKKTIHPFLYWSCTKDHPSWTKDSLIDSFRVTNFTDGSSDWVNQSQVYAGCRPVRLVEVLSSN